MPFDRHQLLAVTLGWSTLGSHAPHPGRLRRAAGSGAIRSLADRAREASSIHPSQGSLLNDPHRPYWGTYAPETRTPTANAAYHNGTAWTWPFPGTAKPGR